MKSNYILLILVIGLLVLSLTSCDSKLDVSTPSSSSVPPSQSSSIASVAPSSEVMQNMPETAVQSGKVLALGAPEIAGFPSDFTIGKQKELDRWSDLIKIQFAFPKCFVVQVDVDYTLH